MTLPLTFDPARHETQFDRDARVVLLGWAGLPGSAAAVDAELRAMPMERFHAAVAHLAGQGFAVTNNGAMRGLTFAGCVEAEARSSAAQRALDAVAGAIDGQVAA